MEFPQTTTILVRRVLLAFGLGYVGFVAADLIVNLAHINSTGEVLKSFLWSGGITQHKLGFIAFLAIFFGTLYQGRPDSVIHEKGKKKISADYGKSRAAQLWRPSDDPNDFIQWAMLKLPSRMGDSHFCVSGVSGSGKTLMIRMLLESIVPHIGKSKGRRIVIFDYKNEFVPILKAIREKYRLSFPIHILNPFQAGIYDRTQGDFGSCDYVAWDLSADIRTPAQAAELAMILVPPRDDQNAYFVNAVRQLVIAVIIAFIENKIEKWSLRDVLLVLRSRSSIENVVHQSREAMNKAQTFLESKSHSFDDVMSSIATELNKFHVVAALSENQKKISLKAWAQGKEESILVIGFDHEHASSIGPINQAIVERLASILVNRPNSLKDAKEQTWVILDEMASVGAIRGIASLLQLGRQKGVCAVLGFQDLESLQDVFKSDKVPATILNQCSNKTFLKASVGTAEWAEKHFGTRLVQEEKYKPFEQTKEFQRNERKVFLSSELTGILDTSFENGLTAIHDVGAIGCFKTEVPLQKVLKEVAEPKEEELFYREPSDQYLDDWKEQDKIRLERVLTPAGNGAQGQTSEKEAAGGEVQKEDFLMRITRRAKQKRSQR